MREGLRREGGGHSNEANGGMQGGEEKRRSLSLGRAAYRFASVSRALVK